MSKEPGCLAAWVCCFIFFLFGYGTCYIVSSPELEEESSVVMETTEEATTTVTEATTTTDTTSTTVITTTTASTTMETTTTVTTDVTDTMTYLGSFKATYYKGSCVPCYGGSGRMLVSCSDGYDGYKGSVASRLVYEQYGYHVNEKTMVYITFGAYPELDGWYSVDDCNADSRIFDFYFADYSTCPWRYDGVTVCNVWI